MRSIPLLLLLAHNAGRGVIVDSIHDRQNLGTVKSQKTPRRM
jgi:hypothetical protein